VTDNTMLHRSAHLAVASLLLALVAGSGSCGDGLAPGRDPDREAPGGATVSNPVTANALMATASAAVLASTVAYVSLVPGTYPTGVSATVSNRRTGAGLRVGLVAGGLDPVPIAAEAGDTLAFAIDTGGTQPLQFTRLVPNFSKASVVRTEPPAGKRDVPLNARVRIVFSEPIDPATITNVTVGLQGAGASVSGDIEVSADALEATFQPAADLLPATDYTIVVGGGIRDSDGTALEAPLTAHFTTGTLAAASARIAFVRAPMPGLDEVPGTPEIYLANTNGSGIVRLTRGRAPAWSPDGRRIAFQRENEIRVINADGSGERRIALGTDPAWSPDGTRIVFDSEGGIFVMNDDGSNAIRVLSDDFLGEPGGLGYPTWLPDGQRISFVVFGNWFDVPSRIYLMNADGSDPRVLNFPDWPCSPPSCPGFFGGIHQERGAWSPDGARIAPGIDGRSESIETMAIIASFDSSGSGFRIHHRDETSVYAGNPEWSPDGRSVAFEKLVTTSGCDFARCPTRIFVVSIEDGSARRLIPEAEGSPDYRDGDPAWSRANE
jgi:TolB protein